MFRRLQDYIMAHLDEPIEVAALAGLAGRSPFHFTRVFSQSVGMSPHRYVVHLRLERAIELMRDGQSGLAEIAASTGFADQSHLSRWVRRVHGVSPTARGLSGSRTGGIFTTHRPPLPKRRPVGATLRKERVLSDSPPLRSIVGDRTTSAPTPTGGSTSIARRPSATEMAVRTRRRFRSPPTSRSGSMRCARSTFWIARPKSPMTKSRSWRRKSVDALSATSASSMTIADGSRRDMASRQR